MRIGVFCSSSNRLAASYYEAASRLGIWIGENGHTLVYGGANCGLMEATAKATHEAGGHIIGVVPQILVDNKRVSQYIDETILTADLNDRKEQLIQQSDILIALPGSVGTLDEVFTVMAANTIGIHQKRILFWNIEGFWDGLFSMLDGLEGTGVVNKPMASIMSKANSFEELIATIEA